MEFFKFDEHVWERLLALLQYDATSPMTLTSGFFLLAFLIFGIGYMAVRHKVTLRTLYVILVSLYFYYKVSGIFVLLLIGIAIIDYLIGNRIAHRKANGKGSKWWVALSVIINAGILIYFKAGGFLEQILNELIDGPYISLGVIAIPTGVSFFIFQTISYIVDISRGTIAPVKRFIDYLFLLSFFPKIFLGPLVRNKEFIPQIESDNLPVTREDIGRAVAYIARGLLKYAVLAKAIDALLLAPATAGDFGEGGMVMLVLLIAFGIRLYCDFSGYSDIAIGIALIMGYKLPDNFDAPFKSATITEFWRRWHISLSTWLRDYVYISLGGNRKGFVRQLFNLVVVMLVCAMWHKVNTPYLVWGLMHGVGLALHKVWLTYVPNSKVLGKDMKPLWRILATTFTFIFITASWAMIYRNDWAGVSEIYGRIFSGLSFADLVTMAHKAGFGLVLVLVGYALHFLPKRFNDLTIKAITRTGLVGEFVVMVVTIWMAMQCQLMLAGSGGGMPLYAEF